jgi:hypothetical protein
MLCRPDKGPSNKNPRFETVAIGKSPASPTPLDVVAFVGDNILDFPGLTQAVRQGGEGAFSKAFYGAESDLQQLGALEELRPRDPATR